MNYCFTKILTTDFDSATARVIEELKKEGFGVLTEIDMKETLKKKLDADIPKYKILGACNPAFAYKALSAEPRIGTMLPCNVVVRELEDKTIEVSAIDPMASMMAVQNKQLEGIATGVQQKLKNVIANL